MIPIASSVRIWLATGHTDMRRGMNGLALQVQQALERDPHAGDLYVFRGRRGPRVSVASRKPALPRFTAVAASYTTPGDTTAAVRAALTLPWSNGQTEGQVNKLKLLKRSMYGRAKRDLLRKRLLLAA